AGCGAAGVSAMGWAAAAPASAAAASRAAAPQPGLNVAYAYPPDVKSLDQARRALAKGASRGAPLIGLDYPDTEPGEPALTSPAATLVAARIDGYMRFDAAGTHRLEFHNNDGFEIAIGGAPVYRHDGRHPCETGGWVEVSVPEPGWYAVEATFFQRHNTSCLMLRWETPDGARAWAPPSIWGR
ncbi:MAG: hypothetical protein AAF192_19625, partial [Pseudomonadota bacterium]